MADRAEVQPQPLVTIDIDGRGRLVINGHVLAYDREKDPREVATMLVSSDFAQPLGRPVRALLTLPDQQSRLVVHPDGRVTDVEPVRPATPSGVPPATRVQAWLAGRDADRLAAELNAARHAGRRRRYPLVLAGAAFLTAAAVVLWSGRGPSADAPTAAESGSPVAGASSGEGSSRSGEAPPAQPVVESVTIRPVAVSGVRAESAPGVLRLHVVAQRRTTARVLVDPVAGSAGPRVLEVRLRGGHDRAVTFSDLAAGRYRWAVVVPGQPRRAGVATVPAVPAPAEVESVPVVYAPPAAPDPADPGPAPDTSPPGASQPQQQPQQQAQGGGRAHGDSDEDPPRPTGVSDGPDRPLDPDGD